MRKTDKIRTTDTTMQASVQHLPQTTSALSLQANQALGPPCHIILDTNFFAYSIRAKIECTLAELEKLGDKFRLALRLAKDERWQRLKCSHPGTYADDCIVSTVKAHRCYLVGTNDKGLRQRLKRIPGVPLVAVAGGKYVVERLPDAQS
ncbi:hypothetical protein DOTSEDRAFT_88984 [Dothistroma septosporum NZE10]|uniref:PIN domain-containing protein n=1 Tax=Dothistroma septosporum (strain NZE10 / CBS 128990) TaxID=675120 RepID=M2XKH3_DOTSN|nr:hypothetical protein DOTSEDRAFT_88984 [Dothistroma septosporum NZE10]